MALNVATPRLPPVIGVVEPLVVLDIWIHPKSGPNLLCSCGPAKVTLAMSRLDSVTSPEFLFSKYGTHKTVRTVFWLWPSYKNP